MSASRDLTREQRMWLLRYANMPHRIPAEERGLAPAANLIRRDFLRHAGAHGDGLYEITPLGREAAGIDERGYDVEVVALVDAINLLHGLRTIESCCGHGEHPFWIWLRADDVASLMPLNYWIDRCHSGLDGWRLTVDTDCSHEPESVKFRLEGPTDAAGYEEARLIATLLVENEIERTEP